MKRAERGGRKSTGLLWSGVLLGICLACGLIALGAYRLPPIHDRLSFRVAGWQAQVQRWLNPPEELVFVPQGPTPPADLESIVAATLTAISAAQQPAATPAGTPSPTVETPAVAPGGTVTAAPAASSPTPALLPPQAMLSGVTHEYQQFNNCGPANLAMALSFWGWQGDQRDTRRFLRPNVKVDDKNVMPAEMVAFIFQHTELHALARVGGEIDLLKRLIAAGFPAVIEAGHDPADDWWMGHYLVVNGYDDQRQAFTVQDSLLNPDQPMPYDELGGHWWRDFNYVYLVIYPPEREPELQTLLGERADETESYRLAEQRALEEIPVLSGRDQFFAWFNLGSSRVGLKDYAGAAQAYDQAFVLYQGLPEEQRPYRLMWYQVGPYEAYYNTGRYADVINLANTTFTWVGQSVLEESYYWRGRAYLAAGQNNLAVHDFQKAAELNPNFAAPRDELAKLGLQTP